MLGTSGNLSAVIHRDPLRLLITGSGVDKGSIGPQHILSIDENGEPLQPTDLRPSDERLLHVRVASIKRAGAVMHTHSVWSTMLSRRHHAARVLAIENYEMLKGLRGVHTHRHHEEIPILDNDQDLVAVAGRLERSLEMYPQAHGFLLEGHGLYTWGVDLAEARRHVEILEFLMEVVGRTYGYCQHS
jgi:methylthioribulose-1-phosphate dehydratase